MTEPDTLSRSPAELFDAAAALLEQGRANEALWSASQAVLLRDDAETRSLFVQCLRSAERIPGVPEFGRLLIRALREGWARPVYLTGPAIGVITNQQPVAAAIRAAVASWPRRLGPQEIGEAVGVLVQDELLRAVLDHGVVSHPGLERLLATVRAILLDAAVHARSEIAKEMVGFACSLARQCFINEYVFDVSDHERQALAWLRSQTRTALANRSNVLAIHLIAIASYAPLSSLERDQVLLERRWLKPLAALILEQVREPQIEATLRAAMPRLTEIADPVSVEVRQQYEDNPYPRWVSVAPTPPEESVLAHLRAMFPHGPLQELREPESLDILVAGCGTGQQPLGTAQRFPRARVLAIDLSLASLAYAKRKSDAAGVAIDYGQADILELNFDRRFDIVESTGVLHHLADPMRGWASLARLVKPGGFMRIGLYSELGRQNVVALRQMIAERGYKATPDDIRRARQEMMSGDASRFASILHSPDFFSVSACRDLLFHVQEHRLTLPRIGAFLTERGLRLLGFELDAPTAAAYRAAFPQDLTMTDLALWDRFETANPDTFRGMYNFWAWKPA
jgi:2-polyprenyl-3-methyl-5-hydroxy-6-metoxy-1,4-benzoquinol methylase